MDITLQWKKWKNSFLDLFFPPSCRVCRSQLTAGTESPLCPSCRERVAYVCSPLCTVCGKAFKEGGRGDHLCEECLRHPPPYRMARAITYYAEPVSEMLHHLKYGFDTTTVPPLLKIVQHYDFSSFPASDLIVPVPLYRSRLQHRGFNHALTLAHIFFADGKKKINSTLLVRTRDTVSQTTLNGVARRKNLKNAFSVKNKKLIQDRTICLVDDVFTTGTTVGECARTLVAAGAREVNVLTMARVKERN